MKKIILAIITLILMILHFHSIQAQTAPPQSDLPNPFEVLGKSTKQNNYMTALFELKANEEKYLASPMWKGIYLDLMTILQGYIGDYDEAYRYENLLYDGSPGYFQARKTLAADLAAPPLAGYKMLDALDAIENSAANRQVVMINEEHRTPFHRAITLQLLSRLYAQGFRYFAAETLAMDTPFTKEDVQLNTRKFPVQSTGDYTADPLYADVIRTALRLGYKVVPYESIDYSCRPTAENPMLCDDKRERAQAQNLYDRILKNDSQAKIFVHVGRGHNSEAATGSRDFNFMGYYFKQLTKIDPLTIDQTHFSERRDTAYEQPLYRYLTKNNLLQKPSVFQVVDGSFYAAAGNDMVIFHPRMKYENGRATFLKMNGLRRAEKINLKKLNLKADKNIFAGSDPVLIQAFYSQESADAVPIDQIIVYPDREIPVLMLPKGKFRIRAIDRNSKIAGENYSLNIKGDK